MINRDLNLLGYIPFFEFIQNTFFHHDLLKVLLRIDRIESSFLEVSNLLL
jgi:hypothetical protein